MAGLKGPSNGMDVRAIGESLPTARRQYRRTSSRPLAKPMPASLPACFADVWRHRQSTLPAHRRERATLEAVASTIPTDASALTGEPAAAVYLASLIVALHRLLETSSAVKVNSLADEDTNAKALSRRERKKLRKKERVAESTLRDMPAADALGSKEGLDDGDGSMHIDEVAGDGDDHANVGEEGGGDVELIGSLVYLIGLSVRGSSQALLNTKCESILDVVMNAHDHVSGSAPVSRHTSTVFASVLAALDSSSWSKPVVQRAFLCLLQQTFENDAKSRRKAREALDALLKSPRAPLVRSRTSKSASFHYVSELKLESNKLDRAVGEGTVEEGTSNAVGLVYLLTSIERFGVFLAPPDASAVCKELVLIAMKNLPNVSSFAFTALNSLFKRRRSCSSDGGNSSDDVTLLPQADLGKLLEALFQHVLHQDCSHDMLIAYSTCLANGAVAYASYYSFCSPPAEFVMKPVEILCSIMSSCEGRSDVTKSVASSLQKLLSGRWFRGKPEVLATIQPFSTASYRYLWPDTVPVLKRYLEDQMAAGSSSMRDAVSALAKAMVSAREEAVAAIDKKHQDLVYGIFLSLIRGGGAECTLSACEVRYDKKLHVTNAWLLPILRDGLCGAPLSLFQKVFVPLAEQLKEAKISVYKENRSVEAKNLGIYYLQVWNLLPGFCHKPSDLDHPGVFSAAFKAIHFCLVAEDEPAMNLAGIGALRQLSESIMLMRSDGLATTAAKSSFGGRLKKLFPALTTLTEQTSDDRRDSLLQAVTKSCRATSQPELVAGLLRKTVRRLLESQLGGPKNHSGDSDEMTEEDDGTVRKRHAIADMAIAIAESGIVPAEAAEISFLERAMTPFFLDPKQSSLQKKAYKASALLVGLGAHSENVPDLIKFADNTARARATVAPGAKAPRMGLVAALVNQNMQIRKSDEKLSYIKQVTDLFLPETVLGTRDVAEKTRSASFETLIIMARAWNSLPSGAEADGLRQFFTAVSAGLGGRTVSMLSATLTSLGRLMYEFRGEAAASVQLANDVDALFASVTKAGEDDERMTSNEEPATSNHHVLVQAGPVAILLRHSAAEIQKAALGVVKIATKVLSTPPSRLVAVLPGILPGLVHVAANSKKQETRLRVRVILERLLRKCGRDVLEANFPEDHVKLLSAVRKKYSRDLIKKHEAKDKKRENRREQMKGDEKRIATQEGADSDDNPLLEDSDSDIEREILDGDDLLSSQKKAVHNKMPGLRQAKGETNDVVDLLDARGAHSVLAQGEVESASRNARSEQKRRRVSRNDDVIKYTDDGRPIFVDSDADSGEVEVGSISNEDADSDQDVTLSNEPKDAIRVATGKRRRKDMEEETRSAKKPKGSFGEEYKSKKARGDVKRAGRPDPYAYVPLGASMLSASPRLGSSGRSGGAKGSSLQRLKSSRTSKKRRRLVGVPGRR